MAQNVPKSKRTRSRVTPKASQAPAPARRTRMDRRRFWVQVTAGFLVIAMLLPILIAFIS